MYARKVVPILLIAGGVMMFMHHKRLELMGEGAEGEQHRPMGPRGLHGSHGEWSKRVPPMFEMWHKEEDKTVAVRGAALELLLKDGRTLGLKGREGLILLDGREIARVDLNGAIQATFADYVMRTEHATYDHQQRVISSPGAVEISGRALQLRGDSMEVDVDAERLTLRHNVSMEIQPALLKQGGSDAPL